MGCSKSKLPDQRTNLAKTTEDFEFNLGQSTLLSNPHTKSFVNIGKSGIISQVIPKKQSEVNSNSINLSFFSPEVASVYSNILPDWKDRIHQQNLVLVIDLKCKHTASNHEFDVIYNGYMNEETDKFEGPGIC